MEGVEKMIVAILFMYLLKLGFMELAVLLCCWCFDWEFNWGYAFALWLILCVIGTDVEIERR